MSHSRSPFVVSLSIAVLVLSLAPPSALAQPTPAEWESIPGVREWSGRLLVKPKVHGVAARDQRARTRLANAVIDHADSVDEYIVVAPTPWDDRAYAEFLIATGDYEYVAPDWRVRATAVPNDPLYPSQWHHQTIRSEFAWDLGVGSPSIVVAICDSGIDLDHPDLVDRLVPGYNVVDELGQIDGGQVDGLTDHGTAVAGCVAATGDNGLGLAGVSWNTSLMPIRVSNQPDDMALTSSLTGGARWAAENGAKIVNVSFSGVNHPSVRTTGDYLRSLGVHLVWSAGNDAVTLGAYDPESVFIVGATDPTDAPTFFTNRGDALDLVAPGLDIWTTHLDGDYDFISGTSFSSPIAAGALALVHAAFPGVDVVAAEAILTGSAHDLGAPGEDEIFGAGRLDVGAAVALAITASQGMTTPVARDDRATTPINTAVTIEPLLNDYDLDGDPLEIIAFEPTGSGGGSVVLDGALLTYTPAAGFEGVETFGYTIADSTDQASSATVTVTVARAPSFIDEGSVSIGASGATVETRTGDIDGDGRLDLVVLTGLGVSILWGQPGGHFQPGPFQFLSGGVNGFAIGDLDEDGAIDIAALRSFGPIATIFFQQPDGTFGAEQSIDAPMAAKSIEVVDLDSDGHLDVVVAGLTGDIIVHWGAGPLGFDGSTMLDGGIGPAGLVIDDIDLDGHRDILTTSTGTQDVSILRGLGARTFRPEEVYPSAGVAERIAVDDVDGDGRPDVILLYGGFLFPTTGLAWLPGRELAGAWAGLDSPRFIGAQAEQPFAFTTADFDRDGDIDAAVGYLGGHELRVFPGVETPQGDEWAAVPSLHDTQFGVFDVLSGDHDNDGDIDLAVVRAGGTVIWYRNPLEPVEFIRGDVQVDGAITITDAFALLAGLFSGTPWPIPCLDRADIDDSGAIDLADAVSLLLYLFDDGPPPATPFPSPGPDPTQDAIPCVE